MIINSYLALHQYYLELDSLYNQSCQLGQIQLGRVLAMEATPIEAHIEPEMELYLPPLLLKHS